MLSRLAPLTWDLSTEYLTQISEQVNQRIKNIIRYHIEDDKHAYLLYSTSDYLIPIHFSCQMYLTVTFLASVTEDLD